MTPAHTAIVAFLGLLPVQDGDCFGFRLEPAGDVSGDGVSEVLLADPTFCSGGEKQAVGAVWLFDPVKNLALRRWEGDESNDRFGQGLAITPDLDGDRVSDCLAWGTREKGGVASVTWRVLSTATGKVIRTGQLAGASRYVYLSLLPDTDKGESVDACMLSAIVDPIKHVLDVRVSGLATGRSLWATSFTNPRCALVHSGVVPGDALSRSEWSALIVGRDDTNEPWAVLPPKDSWCASSLHLVNSSGAKQDLEFGADACKRACLGFRAIGGVDLDGDLVRDWVVANPGDEPFEARLAAVSGSDGKLLWRMPGSAATANARSLCWSRDEDGDGIAEVVIGSPGTVGTDQRMCVISGKSGKPLRTISRNGEEGDTTYFGSALCSVGDVDGDGAHDLVVAAVSPGGWAHEPGVVRVVSGRSGATIRSAYRSTIEAPPKER